ncbi:energy-coupling factor transporter transmembrane component T family protein [Virgibacillus soli]|uniref:Energy-coupling factor transporter transmembrane component T n=1 Tax=Paracerasibacillus soli TaxID=480284 RepID=A0ABU5CVG6_9BACI|nr:energy-coupling factor transporter transmembrane component T [Virgibacillus soli]MDY0410368.1 energy-coupling factor transporter transmembrane component T [Virgibacillus soli]
MFLHHLNPSVKALTIVILVVLIAFIFDPVTPFLFLISTISITFLGGKVKWKRYILYFLPFTIFSFGMLWTTIVFAEVPKNPNEIITIFGLQYPRESFLTALALAVRVLSVAALSLLFIFTTNVIDFILSLIQQFRLPPKIAYGVLAGYRFLPMMRDELKTIHAAHRIRGVNQAKTLAGKWQQYRRFAIPLLASAIRKAERTAMAMESKGFTGGRKRTFYRIFSVSKADYIFLAVMIVMFLVASAISWQLGYLEIFN